MVGDEQDQFNNPPTQLSEEIAIIIDKLIFSMII